MNGHILQIFWGADVIVQFVLLLLIGISIVSWAIIVFKHREIKRSRASSRKFFDAFWRTQSLDELFTKFASQESPLSNIFRAAIADFLRKKGEKKGPPNMEGIRRQVERAVENEIERIERYVPFLATTGSATPFIGLFGTVWGILAAFWNIGRAGSSSLAVVGPFIAEALIATAMGLAAAIPAVIFYNFFVTRIRSFVREVQNFGEDIVSRIERDYFQA